MNSEKLASIIECINDKAEKDHDYAVLDRMKKAAANISRYKNSKNLRQKVKGYHYIYNVIKRRSYLQEEVKSIIECFNDEEMVFIKEFEDVRKEN